MPSSSSLPSPAELVGDISSTKILESELHHIKIKNALAVLQIILPDALRTAAEGNVRMKNAITRAWPYIQSLS